MTEYNVDSSLKSLIRRGKSHTGPRTIDSLSYSYTRGRMTGLTERAATNRLSVWCQSVVRQHRPSAEECIGQWQCIILYQKGLLTKNNGVTVFRGWEEAVRRYNGGGNPNYKEEVLQFLNSAK